LELDLAVRIGRGHAASVGAIALLVIALLIGFGAANHDAVLVRQEFTPTLRSCNDMIRLSDELRIDQTDYFRAEPLVAGAEARFKHHVAEWRDAQQEAYVVPASQQDRGMLDAIGHRFDQLLRVDVGLRRALAQGKSAVAQRQYANEAQQASDALANAIRTLRRTLLARLNLDEVAESQMLWNLERVAFLIAGTAVCLVLFAWRRTVADIVVPLRALQAGVSAVAAGDYVEVHHSAASRTYQIAALEQAYNGMVATVFRLTHQLQEVNAGLERDVANRTAELTDANMMLERQVGELQALDRMKSNFMAVVSHELLTPINFITGFGSMLEDGLLGPLEPRQQHAVGKMLGGASRLTRMVRNVLEYAQLAAGRLELRPGNVDYGALVTEGVQAARLKAVEQQQSLELTLPASLPLAWGDAERLAQILAELLDNASKFTAPGGRLRVAVSSTENQLVTVVSDSGVGIQLAALPDITKPFVQADASLTRQHGGLGLGLAIVYHLVTGLGGTIEVRSSPGEGTSVTYSIPRADSGRG
jgi:signal transduction histidine kinase